MSPICNRLCEDIYHGKWVQCIVFLHIGVTELPPLLFSRQLNKNRSPQMTGGAGLNLKKLRRSVKCTSAYKVQTVGFNAQVYYMQTFNG